MMIGARRLGLHAPKQWSREGAEVTMCVSQSPVIDLSVGPESSPLTLENPQ